MMFLALGSLLSAPGALHAQGRGGGRGPQSEDAGPLRFQYMGPQNAGRFAAVAGVPDDPSTYYLGAASGGVWKTNDGGETWTPLFDEQPVQAIGALAVAPSDPSTVWAGTGEAWAIRDADVMGDGVYKSTDAGATWANMGLRETGRIGRIVVHPSDPAIVFVCALGRTTGPQEERGVFRTTDGGRSWERVLFVDPDTGCSGLAMDPNDPSVLFAGSWDVVMHTWAMFSGGPGSGVHVSRDGGTTWARIEHPGLPESPVGKIDVAVAPSNSNRVYALIQTADQGSLWRSDDGGESWRVVSWDRRLIGRAGYYIRVAVNPADEDHVLVANSSFHQSFDGGLTFPRGNGGCGDCHDIWVDLKDPNHWATTGDGGAGITRDNGESFERLSLPIGQMYHVAVDHRVPYWIYSNRQDDGTMRGRSDSPVEVPNVPAYYDDDGVGIGSRFAPQGLGAGARGGAGGGRGAAAGGRGRGGRGGFGDGGGRGGGGGVPWQGRIGGCESGFTIPDPTNPDIVWASCYGNKVTRFDDRLGTARAVEPYMITLDSPPTDIDYRCHWTPPLAIDPFDNETVYYGCQVVFRTQDRGQSWEVISPDLSTQDPARIAFSGGVIGDNLGQFYGEVVFAIAPSKIQRGLVWAGTNDGKMWYTDDGGGSWNDVTANVTGMPEWGTIRQIAPSRFDPGTAYVAVDLHLMDDRAPYLYKTTDFGTTWTSIVGNLPAGHPLDYVMSVAENPNRPGMLFAGTGHWFYYSMDDGRTWTQLREGLPAAPVSWIVVQPEYHDVVVSTYGRGLFILRDITRLEQADQVPPGAAAHLYRPRPGFRQARGGSVEFLYRLGQEAAGQAAGGQEVGGRAAGVQAAGGRSAGQAPGGPVRFEILDAAGAVVRSFEVEDAGPGLQRTSWDLLYEGPRQVELRTIPPDNPHIWQEARFQDQETRPIIHWGIGGPQRTGPLAAPGRYTVRMIVDGRSYAQPFEVLKDPAIPSSEADIAASTEAQIRIRDNINAVVDMTNRIEILRKQIEDLGAAHAGEDDVERPLAELDRKMYDLELRFLSRTEMHSDDKWYVESYKLYLNLIWLYGEVGLGAGDVAGGAEYRPTDSSMATLARLEDELAVARREFRELVETEIPAFNRAMSGKLPPIGGR